jgi:uncharacterized protein (TIGR02147 family)
VTSGIANELQAEFLRRRAAAASSSQRSGSRRYSLRAFAEDLGLSHGFLSRVLRGERHLSQEQAHAIGVRLGLPEDERLRFVDLARVSSLKNSRLRKQVMQANPALQARAHTSSDAYSLLDPTDSHLLKRWYNPALLELVKTPPRAHTARSLARRLGLSLVECEVALERLVAHGFMHKIDADGTTRYAASVGPVGTGDLPSAKIREFHQQMLSKAKEFLERDDQELRHISGITFAADAARLAQAKELIQEFRRRLADIMRSGEPDAVNAVYQLNVQLFRLDKVEPSQKG